MADLQRVARLLAWFVFGVLLAWVWMVPAYAETIPATGPAARWSGQRLNGAAGASNPAYYDGATAAEVGTQQCAYRASTLAPPQTGTFVQFNASYLRSDCTFSVWGSTTGGALTQYCPSGVGSGSPPNMTCSGSSTCPSTGGWTLSGSNCTRPDCAPGEVRNGAGVCEHPCTAGEATTAYRYRGTFRGATAGVATGTATPTPSTLCDGYCTMTPETVDACNAASAVGSPVVCRYTGPKTGAHCTPADGNTTAGEASDNGPAPTYDPCHASGKVAGTVDGVPVCTGEAPKSTESTKTTTTPTSTTNTTTTTYCDGAGACSTTTTSTYTSGGSGPNGTGAGSTTVPGTGPGTAGEGKPTETEEQEKSSFCEENPDSPICKVTSFSGACTASAPACDGDAVQCAQAAEAWKINCAIRTEPTDAAYVLGKAISGGGADAVKSPLDPSLLTTVDVAGIVTGAGSVRTLTGSCIPPQTFSLSGKSYVFDTTLFCQFATIIGYLMVAASSVIAIRMVVSGGNV